MLLLSTPRQSWAGETPEKLFSFIRLDYDIPDTVPAEVTEESLIPSVMEVFGFTEDQCTLTEVDVEPPHEEVEINIDTKPYVGWLELGPLYWDERGIFEVKEILSDGRAKAVPLFTLARLPEYFDREEGIVDYDDEIGFWEAADFFADKGPEAHDAFMLRLREDIGAQPMAIQLSRHRDIGLVTARSKTFIGLTPEGHPFMYTNIYMGDELHSTDYPEKLARIYASRRSYERYLKGNTR